MVLFVRQCDVGGPLSTRAWTLQEDVLSTRVLCWTKDRLTWHCRTCSCAEVDPTGAFVIDAKGYPNRESLYQTSNLKYLRHTPEELKQRLQEARTLASGPMQRFTLHSLWDYIVKNFVTRSITYDSDRLPAISGIAKEVARHTGHTYKAGLWVENIHADLLWRVDGSSTKTRMYTGPSWSWISQVLEKGSKLVTIREQRYPDERRIGASILSIDVVLESEDPYGRITANHAGRSVHRGF